MVAKKKYKKKSAKKKSGRKKWRWPSNSEALQVDPDAVKIARGGGSWASWRAYVADLDDVKLDWWQGKLQMTVDVTKDRYSSKRTEVSIEFTPTVLAQLAAAAVSCEADENYVLPWDKKIFTSK